MLVAEGGAGEPFEATLPAGEYALVFDGPAFSTPRFPLSVAAGGELEPSLALDAFSATTLRSDAGASFEIVDERGARVYAGTLVEAEARRVFLPPGDYVLRVTAGERAIELPFAMPRSEVLDVSLATEVSARR